MHLPLQYFSSTGQRWLATQVPGYPLGASQIVPLGHGVGQSGSASQALKPSEVLQYSEAGQVPHDTVLPHPSDIEPQLWVYATPEMSTVQATASVTGTQTLVKVNLSCATGRLQPIGDPGPAGKQVASDDPTPATWTCASTVPGTLLTGVA